MPVGGARLRALLTALALAGGRSVRTGELAATVWAESGEVPADEPAAVQALVGRLRRALGRDAVASADGGGYRLAAERDAVDLFRFERLADEGAASLAEGDAAKAFAVLDEALALWRGPALADLPDGGGPEGVRVTARWLAARRDRLDAGLALGRAAQLLPEARQLAAEHPLDESLQALHLRALRDAGRVAEALAAYEGVRTSLVERLGVDPGPALRALHAELLRAGEDPEAGAGAGAGAGGGAGAADGAAGDSRGPGRTGASGGPAPASAPPVTPPGTPPVTPLPSGPARAGTGGGGARAGVPGNLRARLTSFVGRDEEIGAIREDLGAARLVTLTGPGGAGKTRLSQEAASRARDAFGAAWEDGVWVVELAPVRDPDSIAETVLTALGGRETVLRSSAAEGLRAATDPHALDPLAQLAERCSTRRMLLVLDNCEHVIDAAAKLAETLLVECPGVTVLATSREPLGVPGESVRPVEPLPDAVALRLLADRGASARPGFRTEDDPEACAEICHRLDGLPLAIELAAARLRSLTPRQLADRLDDRFRLLTSGSRTVLPRQQTLRAVVDWSWELLNGAERAVLRRLSVFSGGCELEQAEPVCGDGDLVPSAEVAALLGSLVDKSLVIAVPPHEHPESGGGMRYVLLETVSEYAADKLDAAGGAEREAARRRHLTTYRELARLADPLLRGPRQRGWLDRLEREHDNIRTALRRAIDAHDEQEALCLTLAMGWFWQLRDHRSDARTWAEASADLGPDPFAAPVVPAPDIPDRCTDAPPPMREELLWEARRQVRMMALADPEEGMSELETPERQDEMLRITQVYHGGMPQTCRVPGSMWLMAWIMLGRFDQLTQLTDEMVSGCREFGYEWELAFALQLRAKLSGDRSDKAEQAARDSEESLEIFTRIGDAWGEAEALSGRAESLCARGDFAGGAEAYRGAIARAAHLGAHSQIPLLKSRLGASLLDTGDPEDVAEGDRLLRESAEEAEHVSRDGPNFAAIQLATHCARTGETAQARELLEPLEAQFADQAPLLFGGLVQGLLAWTYCLEGEYATALAKVRVSIGKTRNMIAETVAPQLTFSQFLTAAWALAPLGHARTAGRLLGVYDALVDPPGGCLPPPVDRETRESAEAAVRAVLDDEAYAAVYTEGDGLSMEEAVALVQETPGD